MIQNTGGKKTARLHKVTLISRTMHLIDQRSNP